MSGGHYVLKCVHCTAVIAQCRCPSPDKQVRLGVCADCNEKHPLQVKD